jgi:hypothetical protein
MERGLGRSRFAFAVANQALSHEKADENTLHF